jgi:hypothetical protein
MLISVRTDDKAYNWKTAAISFIFLSIVLLISKILNINMPQELILISAYQRQARIQEFLVGGDDMDEEKIGRSLGAAVGPQRGPGAEPLVGVKGAKPPTKVTLFSRIIQ